MTLHFTNSTNFTSRTNINNFGLVHAEEDICFPAEAPFKQVIFSSNNVNETFSRCIFMSSLTHAERLF